MPEPPGPTRRSKDTVSLGVRHAVGADGRSALCARDRPDQRGDLSWDTTRTAPLCVACLRVVGNRRHGEADPATS